MKRSIIIFIILISLVGCVSAPPPASKPTREMVDIRLPVGYIPNVQFAPIYVAIDKGYFAEEGINLTLDYSFEIDAVALLGANELQFAIASGEQVLLARGQDIPVVYVLAWYQKYPVAIASKSGRGILKPEDLRGKVVGTPILSGASYIGLRAIMDAGNLTDKDLSIEVVGFNQAEMLATDQVDAVVVYVANEPVLLEHQGYQTDLIRVDDYLTLVSNGLITNEKTINDNPELVRSMVRALYRGIQDTIANPDEAYDICTGFVETLTQQDKALQGEVLSLSIELWQGSTLGASDPVAWENMQIMLKKMGMVKVDLDVSSAFTNDFLP